MNYRSINSKFTYKFLKTLKRLNHKKATPDHRTIKLASDWSLASAVGSRKAWSRAVIRKIRRRRIGYQGLTRGKGRYSNYIDRKTNELRGLVPGGEEMDVFKLFGETAHYIKCLTTQVNAMKNIVDLFSNST